MERFQSWGRYPPVVQRVKRLDWRSSDISNEIEHTSLAYGMGRSYGDCCLNDGGWVLCTRGLDRLISFDPGSGVLHCEAGVTLAELLEFSVPRGWFLPVSPGTKFITIGGAIANDIHGKNHHRRGTLGKHLHSIELLRSDGERLFCSTRKDGELFRATIGGLGLTGLILSAKIQLIPIDSALIDMQSIKFGSLDEFFEISMDSDQDYEYTVAWVDVLAQGANLGRGIFMRGNHSSHRPDTLRTKRNGIPLSVPFDFPNFALNKWSIKAFNFCYYQRQHEKQVASKQHYEPFFYPLDSIHNWNRIYGKRGFLQFQCIVSPSPDKAAIRSIFEIIARSGQGSFLAVLKEFGSVESPGMLSFPRPGTTLTLDFANLGEPTLQLLERLEKIVVDNAGAMYPAKDASMRPESFKQFYPQWEKFSEYIDPKFSSSLWRRVTRE